MQAKIKHVGMAGILVGMALTALTTLQTNAAFDSSLTFPTCALSIHNFKIGGDYKNEYDNQWYNVFTGTGTCTQHLQYPNQYTPQPPILAENPLAPKAGVENTYAPKTIHNHIYHNASKEDQDSTPLDNYWYKSYMAKFQIILENDALLNTDKVQIVCGTPTGVGTYVETPGCNGSVNYWGTTNISFNQTTGVVTWDFAEQPSKTGRPMLWGNNPSLGKSHGYFGTYVKLVSKDNPSQVWSATTTSRVLIRDLALRVNSSSDGTVDGDESSCANDGQPGNVQDYNGHWCTTNPPSMSGVEGTEMNDGKQYYWFRIGVVGTTWQKPAPQEKVCSNLALDILQNGQHYSPGNVTGLQPNTPMTLTVTPSFTGTGTDPILHYVWKTTPLDGTFKDSQASPAPGQNSFTDGDNDTLSYYSGGNPLTKVIVDAYNQANQPQNPCHQEFIIPPTPPPSYVCDYVELTPMTVNPPTVNAGKTDYTATVHFKDSNNVPTANPFNTTVHWSGSPGTLSNGANQTQMSNTNFLNTFTATGVPASVSVNVTNIVGAQNSAQCQQGVTVNTPPEQGECLTIGATTSTDPLHEGETTFITVNPQYSGGLQPQTITWSESGAGSFIKAGFLPPYCPAIINGSATVPKNCFAYTYFAGNAGDSYSVSVNPDPTNNAACEFTRPVLPPQPPSVACDYIERIQPSPWELNANGDTDLRVRVHYDDGNTYNTHVRWTGSNGNYNGNATSDQTHTSANTFNEKFTSTSDNSSANVRVTEFWDAANVQHDVTTGACATGLQIKTPEYKCEYVHPIYQNGQTCLQTNPEYEGGFSWDINGDGVTDFTTNSPNCENIPPDTDYHIFATTEPNNPACELEDTTPQQPPKLEKRFSKNGNDYRTGTVTIPATQDKVYYQLTFTPNSPKTSATITDTISEDGYLLAELLPANGQNAPTPGRIVYSDEMELFEQGYGPLENCQDIDFGTDDPSHCYTGDIGDSFGVRLVRVDGKVTITYTGKVQSALADPDVCKTSDVCQEKYRNRAQANNIVVWVDDENTIQYPPVYSEEIVVQIFCQYILTRAAGDIFLETDLNAGVDILMCSRYKSSTGIILTPGQPDTPEIVSTGAGDTEIFTIGHEICTQGQTGTISGELSSLYGQSVVQNLSSQICEVRLRTGSPWKQKVITNSVDENKTRISRWEPTVSGISSSLGSLVNQYPDEQVYHVKGGDLTVDQDFTLNDGDGAKTFIVEDGNLVINSSILYGACNKTDGTQCNARDIASLAFIVINGNIYVDKNVEQLSGVFYVQEGDSGTGKLYSGTKSGGLYSTADLSTTKLTVNGSVYGDIDPLFTYRAYAGDPALEEGGIVIRFDERVILNTPAGLRDVLNLSQSEVAR